MGQGKGGSKKLILEGATMWKKKIAHGGAHLIRWIYTKGIFNLIVGAMAPSHLAPLLGES